MHTCIHSRIATYMHAYIYTYIHAYIHAYMYTFMHSYIHACIHIYVHSCIHTYMHTYRHGLIIRGFFPISLVTISVSVRQFAVPTCCRHHRSQQSLRETKCSGNPGWRSGWYGISCLTQIITFCKLWVMSYDILTWPQEMASQSEDLFETRDDPNSTGGFNHFGKKKIQF
jgi:hypothetical protein